ncbi:MAG: hypothetical protein M3464_12515 [Chloroflexota bacterium]|nr:hypothetical protein [Chloroflexota bacterium]
MDEVNGDEDAIIGIFRNGYKEELGGFVIVAGVCFDRAAFRPSTRSAPLAAARFPPGIRFPSP